MNASFNNNTMSSNGLLTATFSNLSAVTPGIYNVYVNATNGVDVERRNLYVTVYNSNITDTVITYPINGSALESADLTLTWNDDFNALSYLVEVATDVTFNNIIHTVNTTELNEVLSNLTEGQVYYTRIYPSNNCGTSSSAIISSFQVANSN
jgi:hypothetical protein